MALFELADDGLNEVPATHYRDAEIRERDDLQRVLRDKIKVIDPDILIIAEEFNEWTESNRRIDLLGIDRQGNLIVIEIKRSESGGHMELQAIRYAAMVAPMRFQQAVQVYGRFLEKREQSKEDAEEQLLEHLNDADPENFGTSVRVILVAADFSKELTTSVIWLNEQGLDIQCVRLKPYDLDGRILLDVHRIVPLPEAEAYIVRLNEKSSEQRMMQKQRGKWSGYYFVNVGMDDPNEPESRGRHWNNCRKYGYIAAGGSPWSDRLMNLTVGDRLFAYVKKSGYVGFGTVSREATPVHEFKLPNGVTLDETLGGAWPSNQLSNEAKWEYAIGVTWQAQCDIKDAKWFSGASALPHNVYKLRDEKTVSYLCEKFKVEDASVSDT